MNTEMTKYYNELCDAYDRNELYFTTNEGRAHNAMIMRVMLEKAESVSMYCGEMSVFRKGFYKHIKDRDEVLGAELETLMSETLTAFLKDPKKKLTILLEKFDKRYLEDLIISKEKFIDSNVALLELPDTIGNKKYLPHISFTGDERMVRVEMDKFSHEAVCKIGTSPDVDSPSQTFRRLMKLANPVSLAG